MRSPTTVRDGRDSADCRPRGCALGWQGAERHAPRGEERRPGRIVHARQGRGLSREAGALSCRPKGDSTGSWREEGRCDELCISGQACRGPYVGWPAARSDCLRRPAPETAAGFQGRGYGSGGDSKWGTARGQRTEVAGMKPDDRLEAAGLESLLAVRVRGGGRSKDVSSYSF